MMSLEALEHRFLGHVRGLSVFPREACEEGRVGSARGLAIYAHAYGARLREALENDHPMLARYLGDTLWNSFCSGYIKDHPSRVRSLRTFGEFSPAWLSAHPPFSAHPVLAELARFERVLLDVFDAADAPRLEGSVLLSLDATAWPDLRLGFHPSVRLLPLKTNAVEVWRALKDDTSPPVITASPALGHLLWRDEARVTRFRPVDEDEWIALETSLVKGQDFSSLCERLSLKCPPDEVPTLALRLLRRWLDEGGVSAFFTDEP